MEKDKEIVVSLTRLLLPEEVEPRKVIISVAGSKGQQFIQKERTIKNRQINLYRECIFLSGVQSMLLFRIYSVSESGQRTLLRELTASEQDLSSIGSKPATLKIKEAGYELTWDSWIFSEESQDLNSLTDRDYSELDLPLVNLEESDDELNTQIVNHVKQLSSTDGSWSPLSEDFSELEGKFPSAVDEHNERFGKRLSALEQREKRNIKNEVYHKLIKGISGIFSDKKLSLKPN